MKRPPPSSKLKKRLITWGSIALVLVLVFVGLLKLGMHYSGDILYQLVKKETNGYYQLSFEKIDIDWWNRAIDLEKVLLKPDSTKDFRAKGLNNLYDLEMAGLHIDLESISSIYMDRQLAIENVRIIDPQIHIIREAHAPDESFSLQTGNLYNEISAYLKVLRIDLFSIENGALAHTPSELGLGNIDFSVSNLLMDGTTRPDQHFYSENIELEIRNQSFMMTDSIHLLSFDRLLLSTADSVLTFENLVLKPITEAHGTFERLDHKIVYDITIPKLRLKGVDYFSAYRNNHLVMEELSLTDSDIVLEEQTHDKRDRPESKGNSLIKQLFQIFDEVKIGKMRFINTNLDITTNDDYHDKYQHVQSERADIVLYKVFIDSSNYHFDHREKYFEDVDIIIKDYSSFLPDSVHTINFDLLQLSSFDSSLVFKNFNISNNGKGNTSDMFLTIDLPLISLKGLNYLDVLMEQELLIKEMRLQKPNIIFEKKPGKSEKVDLSPDRVYAMLADHFKVIEIEKLLLDQGEFSINKQVSFGQADLLVSNFNMDNNSISWYDVLDEVELKMQHMVVHDKTTNITARHLKLDRTASRLVLDELRIDHQDENTSASGDLMKVTIAGIHLDSICMGNYLAFDSISLFEPQVTIDILKPGEGSFKSDLLGDKTIEVIHGKMSGKKYDSTRFSFNNINTKLTLGAISNIEYAQAEQIHFTSPKSNIQLNISDLYLERSQSLTIKDIELHPIHDSLLHKMELNASIPTLTLHGLNQNAFWQQHTIAGDSLIIDTPDLDLTLNDIILSDSVITSTDPIEVAFQKIIIDKADVVFSDKGQIAVDMIQTPELSLTLEGFQYPQNAVLNAEHILYADDVTLNLKDFQPIMTNGDSLFIRELDFNKKDALINIDTLSYDKANGTASALLSSTRIVGLDFHAYLNEQLLKLDSIQFTTSRISLNKKGPKKDKEGKNKTIPESIDIKYFSSKATEIELKDSLKQYAVHKGNFEVHDFLVEGEIIWDKFLDYAQFASISGEDLALPLGDGYHISVDQYNIQHPKNSLSLENINLTSDYTADQYSSNLTFQNDWFDVRVDGITLSGVDFERSLVSQEFKTEKVLLDGLNALVYRDKAIPFNSAVVKHLPQSMLRAIDQWIYIDTLQVNGDITYQEKPLDKEEIAEISFNHLDASLFNITSVDSMTDIPMRFIAKGQLADTANFDINVIFDMQDPKDGFVFTGQVDSLELTALNKLLRPIGGLIIKDGYAESIWFNIEANNEIATGEMKFRYDHLKVQILNPETNDLHGLSQGIKTFMANAFVLKHKNPKTLFLRPGKIFFQRDSTRAIFNYWGKAILSGAASSVGIHKSRKAEKKYKKELRRKKG